MALGSGRRIVVEFIGDASSLKANAKSGEAALSGFSGKAQAAGRIAGKALAGGLLLAGAAAVSATKAAAEDEAAQAQLAQQLKQAANATNGQIASVEAWISKASLATGVADDELRPAFAKLATATGDVGEAQDLLTKAMDIAAGSGQSLETVTKTLAKAQTTGSVAAYAKLGGATKDAHGNTLSLADATQALADKYKGAAADAANTTAGKTKIMTVQFGELQEQIGAKLLPIMTKLAQIGLQVVNWISRNTTTVGILVGALGGLLAITWAVGVATKAGAAAQAIWSAATAVSAAVSKAMNSTFVLRLQLLALDAAAWLKSTAALVANKVATVAATVASVAMSAATKAMAAAQWLLNAAMSANPIGLIVIAIAALVAGLILAYKHSETFRNIVNAAFSAIMAVVKPIIDWFAVTIPAVFGAVVDFIRQHWQLIVSIIGGPLVAIGILVVKHWGDIKQFIGNAITSILDWLTGLPGKAKTALSDLVSNVRDLFDQAMTAGLNKVTGIGKDIKDWIEGIPGKLVEKVADFKSAGAALMQAVVDGMKNAAGVIEGIASNVWTAVKGLLNSAIAKINAALDFTISLPGPDIHVNIPDIPQLAKGGIVRKPMLALIGEDGPEAVVPLGKKNAPKGSIPMGGGGGTVNIYLQSLDPRGAGKAVVDALREYERQTGRPMLVSAT